MESLNIYIIFFFLLPIGVHLRMKVDKFMLKSIKEIFQKHLPEQVDLGLFESSGTYLGFNVQYVNVSPKLSLGGVEYTTEYCPDVVDTDYGELMDFTVYFKKFSLLYEDKGLFSTKEKTISLKPSKVNVILNLKKRPDCKTEVSSVKVLYIRDYTKLNIGIHRLTPDDDKYSIMWSVKTRIEEKIQEIFTATLNERPIPGYQDCPEDKET